MIFFSIQEIWENRKYRHFFIRDIGLDHLLSHLLLLDFSLHFLFLFFFPLITSSILARFGTVNPPLSVTVDSNSVDPHNCWSQLLMKNEFGGWPKLYRFVRVFVCSQKALPLFRCVFSYCFALKQASGDGPIGLGRLTTQSMKSFASAPVTSTSPKSDQLSAFKVLSIKAKNRKNAASRASRFIWFHVCDSEDYAKI